MKLLRPVEFYKEISLQSGTIKNFRQRSIELSERAVKLDRLSGPAWLSLANARFGSFFLLEKGHFDALVSSAKIWFR